MSCFSKPLDPHFPLLQDCNPGAMHPTGKHAVTPTLDLLEQQRLSTLSTKAARLFVRPRNSHVGRQLSKTRLRGQPTTVDQPRTVRHEQTVGLEEPWVLAGGNSNWGTAC